MSTQTFSRSFRKGNKYITEEVIETTHNIIKLPFNIPAKITHVGGNGRFRFIQDGVTFRTEFEKNICCADGLYFDYSHVEFEGVGKGNVVIDYWKDQYIGNSDEGYWKPVR